MGFFYHGVPPYMVAWGMENLPNATAVETGTLFGDSALALAEAFGSCQTIEIDPKLAGRATGRFAKDERVEVIEGSSGSVLEQCLRKLKQPPFIWLDAHWISDLGTPPEDPCPLISEIETIGRVFGDRAVVLVDDARVFGAISPSDNINGAWLELLDVLAALRAIGLATFVLDDVVAGIPPQLRDSFARLSEQSWTATAGTITSYLNELERGGDSRAVRLKSKARSYTTALVARLPKQPSS